jgi:arabinose-5-phosphate isomerase
MDAIEIAREVFKIESKEIRNLSNLLTEDFQKAIDLILNSSGKLIISGMGKSGIIGKKIAASLASTGTSSFFLHPGEAYHGDLGMVEKEDVVLLISNSGETDEVLKLIPYLRNQGNQTISMSKDPNSTLAENTKYHLNIAVSQEACPLQLAPTSSTTTTLVMGDALVVALMKARGFLAEDFARYHPGGSLGKKLLTQIKDVMKVDDLPICSENTKIKDIIHTITNGMCGLAIVLKHEKIYGVITDGDIRRAMEERQEIFFSLIASDIMTINPKIISQNEGLVDTEEMMNKNQVSSLIVADNNGLLSGVIQIHDL